MFLSKYKEGIERYVPKYKMKKNKNTWYSTKCAEARKDRRKHGER